MKNDVFLKALLDTPTTKDARRSPLEWLVAMRLHIVIVAGLIIVPLYTTATIHLNEYQAIPLVAPPPPPAPPPPAGGAIAPHIPDDEEPEFPCASQLGFGRSEEDSEKTTQHVVGNSAATSQIQPA